MTAIILQEIKNKIIKKIITLTNKKMKFKNNNNSNLLNLTRNYLQIIKLI